MNLLFSQIQSELKKKKKFQNKGRILLNSVFTKIETTPSLFCTIYMYNYGIEYVHLICFTSSGNAN